jgi:O-antigen/teichoic acid export membrane protein
MEGLNENNVEATREPRDGSSPPGRRNRSRFILMNTLSSYGRDIVDTIAFLVLIPFIISTLGNESFGLWSLIWSFLAIFELADLGFAASVIKYVADARGREDMSRLRNIVCTLFWIYVFLGALVMAGIVASVFFFNKVFQIPPDQAPMAQAVLLIVGVRSALYLPLGMFRGVLVGFQKMNVANAYKVLASLLYLASVLILLTLKPDIRVLAAANLVTGILPMFAMMIHCRRITPGFSLRLRYFDRSLVRELSSFSLYFSFSQIASMIATRADAMVIKLFLPLEAVGIYSVGMRLSEKASQFCSHLTRALSPVFAELHGADEQSNIRAAHYTGAKLTVAFATPLLLGLALLADPLILAWTGPDYRMAVPVCQWLAAAAMVSIIHGNTVNLLSMSGHQKYVALTIFGGQVLNVVLSFLLVRPLGIVGVSMATLIAAIPIYIGLVEGYAGRIQSRSIWHFYRATVFPSVLPASAMVGMFIAIRTFWSLTNLVEVAMLESLGIAVFGLVFWVIGFQTNERKYFREKLIRALFRRDAAKSSALSKMQ